MQVCQSNYVLNNSVATTTASFEDNDSYISQAIRRIAETVCARGVDVCYAPNGIFYEYEKVGELGSGTYAKVYKLKHHKTKRVSAGKVLCPQNFTSNTQNRIIKMFCNEIVLLSRAQGPGTVELYKVLYGKEGILIDQEYVDGGTIWRDGICNSVESRWSHLVMLTQAVQYLHLKGVVHRDLKPTNILRTSDGYIKIADFGWSEEEKKLDTSTNEWPGTLEINPPEILTFKGPVTSKIDNFAVGMNFLLFVSNRFVCRQKEVSVQNAAMQIIKSIQNLHTSKKLPPKFTPEMWGIFLGLTHQDPIKRWSLAQVWHHPWVIRNFLNMLRQNDFDGKRFDRLLWFQPARNLLLSYCIPESVINVYCEVISRNHEKNDEVVPSLNAFSKLGLFLESAEF